MPETTTGPDFAGVLVAHEYALQMRGGGVCACGHVPTINPSTLQTQQDYHRAHLSAALHAEVARWLADAATQQAMGQAMADYETTVDSLEDTSLDGYVTAALAALTTPLALPDEES